MSAERFLSTAPSIVDGNYGASPGLAYDFGRLMVKSGGAVVKGHPLVYPASMRGWVQYPQKPPHWHSGKYPIVILLHGQYHPDVDSFRGYGYMGRYLATNGYIVISVDATDINAEQSIIEDYSSTARAQLILATLDHFFDDQAMKEMYPDLAGRLDRNRIGIVGHSRGGEGVAEVVAMNGRRSAVSLEEVRIAATDLGASKKWNTTAIRSGLAEPTRQTVAWERKYSVLSWVQDTDIRQAISKARPPARPVAINSSLRDAADAASGISDTELRVRLQQARVELAPGADGSEAPPRYQFRAIFALVPTNFANAEIAPDVPLATLISSCDGDILNFQGARLYDSNRFDRTSDLPNGRGDLAPRYQIVLRGGNHKWFNTAWTYGSPVIPTPDVPTQDDAAEKDDDKIRNANDAYCQIASATPGAGTSTPLESIRLTAEDQRKLAIFLVDSFMRYFVGSEQQFSAYWSGASQIPISTCPSGKDHCDDSVLLTIQRPDGERVRVTDFREFLPPPATNVVVNPPTRSRSVYSGFTASIGCASFLSSTDFPLGNRCWSAIMPNSGSTPFVNIGDQSDTYDTTFLASTADHMELEWKVPGASIKTDLAAGHPAGMSVTNSDSLTFRIANAREEAQEVRVTLSDGVHPDVTVDGSRYTDALYTQVPHRPASLPDSNVTHRMVLNMVGIPLAAFGNLDLHHLKTLTIAFPHSSGTIVVTDIEFQNLDRRSAAVP
ncbi:hypothetical protein N0A02_33855 (plasmid) [Paraburkholderia acidicola]|uniref:PET hydrolase/cutinase-like domain-containing protein n=1 Tax=Paraburkholderia acidicola TaxID=1912599 RepID=A0ABV1M069_9BURK